MSGSGWVGGWAHCGAGVGDTGLEAPCKFSSRAPFGGADVVPMQVQPSDRYMYSRGALQSELNAVSQKT